MGLGFLTPLFLGGLAAVIVPVLVHLVRRQTHTAVAFPSLMFVRMLPAPAKRRRTLRDPWLFALRCLIIALLCLAFAQPFLRAAPEAGAGVVPRDRVIVLDRSYSMGYGPRWQAALAAARRAAEELGPRDRAALLLFDYTTTLAAALSSDRERLIAELSALQPGSGHTDVASAVERAAQLLASSEAAARDIVLISDLQRSALERGTRIRVPQGIDIIPIVIGDGAEGNAALVAARLEDEDDGGRRRTRLLARVRNTGHAPMAAVRLALAIDGRDPEQHTFSLAPGETRSTTWSLPDPPAVPTRVRLHLSDDALAVDNAFHLLWAPPRALAVLLLESKESEARAVPYVERALAAGSTPTMRITRAASARLGDVALDTFDVIIVVDTPLPGGELGAQLEGFVRAGGGLLVIAGERVRGAWPGGPDGIVPGVLGITVVRENASPARLAELDATHPALAGLAGPASSPLTTARVYRYRRLDDVEPANVVARYDDGAVALAQRQVGAGRVLVLTTTVDGRWNTLPVTASFVPLLHATARYLAAKAPTPAAFTVGEAIDIAGYAHGYPGGRAAADALLRGATTELSTPSGASEMLAAGRTLVPLGEAGFYEAYVSGTGTASLVVANNARSDVESDLTAMAADALLAAVRYDNAPSAPSPPRAVAALPSDVPWIGWWVMLLACVALLALELLAANRATTEAGR